MKKTVLFVLFVGLGTIYAQLQNDKGEEILPKQGEFGITADLTPTFRPLFTYNINSSQYSVALFNNGKRNIKEISTMMLEYNRAGGKKLDGLVKRRAAEQKLFKGG